MSGTKLKERPTMTEMIEEYEDSRTGCVLTTELDKISRYILQNPAAFHPFYNSWLILWFPDIFPKSIYPAESVKNLYGGQGS